MKKIKDMQFDEEDVLRRAFAAWFRRGANVAIPANTSSVAEHEGKFYVELHNVNGTLAVYRIRNDGMLKKLRRWPSEITVEGARRKNALSRRQ